jgi:hypothetical protein
VRCALCAPAGRDRSIAARGQVQQAACRACSRSLPHGKSRPFHLLFQIVASFTGSCRAVVVWFTNAPPSFRVGRSSQYGRCFFRDENGSVYLCIKCLLVFNLFTIFSEARIFYDFLILWCWF